MKYILFIGLILLTIVACKVQKTVEYIDKTDRTPTSTIALDTTYVEDEKGNLKMVVTQKQEIERRQRTTLSTKKGKDTTYVEQPDGTLKMIITE